MCLSFGDELVLAGSAWSSACSCSSSSAVTLGSEGLVHPFGLLEVLLEGHVGVRLLVALCKFERGGLTSAQLVSRLLPLVAQKSL